jgi:hypothetical protein
VVSESAETLLKARNREIGIDRERERVRVSE